jgi:hypothetical protein
VAGIIRCARDRAAPVLLIHPARGPRDVARVHGIGIGTIMRTLASASPTQGGRIAASPHGSKPRAHLWISLSSLLACRLGQRLLRSH